MLQDSPLDTSDAGAVATGTAVGWLGHWGCVSIMQIRRECLKWNYYHTWFFFIPASHNPHVFEWGLTVNQNQKKDYIRKQLRKDTSSIYDKSMRFLQLAAKLQCWTAHEGLYLPKKKMCIPDSLSLSPPLEERARGEVGGSWTLIGSNHPTAIFGQRIPYLAGIQVVISSHRTVYPHPVLFPLLVRIHSEVWRWRPDDIAIHAMGTVLV